ncbi:MAG: HepT-like ribonuclease domain-containing protein [Nanoarchaeota archaeon]
MTKHENIPYIEDILAAITDIQESIKGFSKDKFLSNKDKKDANVRRLEIIGGASKNLSNELKEEHKEIEWDKIIGTRNRIIHAYSNVDIDILWGIIKKDLPKLKKQIEKIKEELKLKN